MIGSPAAYIYNKVMDWITEILSTDSPVHSIVALSLICALGLALGKVRVMGISLGVAFVFFIGILAGHFGLRVNAQCLGYAETFGLVIFVYMLGLSVGPNFFGSLRREGMPLNLWSLAKRIVEDYHRGRIFVKNSTPGVGTVFRIELRR